MLTYDFQNGPSWLLVDSADKAGGLASTDVTPEGFVSASDLFGLPSALCRLPLTEISSSTM